jgi:hypothetical protein
MLSVLNLARGPCFRPLRQFVFAVSPARDISQSLSCFSSETRNGVRTEVCLDTLRACARLSFLNRHSDVRLAFADLVQTYKASRVAQSMCAQVCVAIAEACGGKTGDNRLCAGLAVLKFVLTELAPQPDASEAHHAAWHQAIQGLCGSKDDGSLHKPHVVCLTHYPKLVGTILTGLHAFPNSPWIAVHALRSLRMLFWTGTAPAAAVGQSITVAVIGAMSSHTSDYDVQLAALRVFQDMEHSWQSDMRCMVPTVMLCVHDALSAHRKRAELQAVGLAVMRSCIDSVTSEAGDSVAPLAVDCVSLAMDAHSQCEAVQVAACRLLESLSATCCLTDTDLMLARVSTAMDLHKDSVVLLDAGVSALVALLEQGRLQRCGPPVKSPPALPATPPECVDVTDLDCVYAPQPVEDVFPRRRRVSDMSPK